MLWFNQEKLNSIAIILLSLTIIFYADISFAQTRVGDENCNPSDRLCQICKTNPSLSICRITQEQDFCSEGHYNSYFCGFCKRNPNSRMCNSTVVPTDPSHPINGGITPDIPVQDPVTPTDEGECGFRCDDGGGSGGSSGGTPPPPQVDECQVDTDCGDYPNVCCVPRGTGKQCVPDCKWNICDGPTAQSMTQCSSYAAYEQWVNWNSVGGKGGLRFPFKTRTDASGHKRDVPASSITVIWESGGAEPHFCACQSGVCEPSGCSVEFDGSGNPTNQCPNVDVNTVHNCNEPSVEDVYAACNMEGWDNGITYNNSMDAMYGKVSGTSAKILNYCAHINDSCHFTLQCANGGTASVQTPCSQ